MSINLRYSALNAANILSEHNARKDGQSHANINAPEISITESSSEKFITTRFNYKVSTENNIGNRVTVQTTEVNSSATITINPKLTELFPNNNAMSAFLLRHMFKSKPAPKVADRIMFGVTFNLIVAAAITYFSDERPKASDYRGFGLGMLLYIGYIVYSANKAPALRNKNQDDNLAEIYEASFYTDDVTASINAEYEYLKSLPGAKTHSIEQLRRREIERYCPKQIEAA